MCKLMVTVLVFLSAGFVSAENTLKLEVYLKESSTKGVILIDLLPEQAPNHVRRIKQLVADGAYDNIVFHRVIEGFMAQTGDVEHGNLNNLDDTSVGTGGSSYPDLYAELSNIAFKTGIVGMARGRYIHSANSQFFIMTAPQSGLNGSYTVVGMLKEGLDLVRKLKNGPQELQGKVTDPDYIMKASII